MRNGVFVVMAFACLLMEARLHADGLGIKEKALPVVMVPRAASPPVLDGDAENPSWAKAAVIHGLSPALDSKGEAERIARMPTTIRLLWDPNYLYLAFDCHGGHADADPKARPGDLLYMHSACEVFLDPVGDGRQYMEFQLSSLGQSVSVVHLLTAAPQYTEMGRLVQSFSDREHWYYTEPSLEGLRVVSGRTNHGDAATGWSLTVALPAGPILRRRGMDHFAPGELRANFARHEFGPDPVTGARTLIPMYWSPVQWGCPHISADLMGRLVLEP